MAIGNFVQETANAPGNAATVTLAGPSAGRAGIIATFGGGATVYLGMESGTLWQVVEALTVAGPPQQITIISVIRNSAGTTTRLNFTGVVRIYSVIPAERNVFVRPNGTVQGATTTGSAVMTAANAAAARTAIGASATGSDVMTAADAAAARAAIGAASAGGQTFTGDLTLDKASPYLFLNRPNASTIAAIQGRVDGLDRWRVEFGNSVAETGGNAGSDFIIARSNDAGAFIDLPLTITRSAGVVNFAHRPTHAGVQLAPQPQSGAGVGQWASFASVLPSGGTWAYMAQSFNGGGNITGFATGVAAGGTTVLSGNVQNYGFAWRIA